MYVFLGFPFKLGTDYRKHMKGICAKRSLQLHFADDHFAADSIWEDIQNEIDEAWYAVFDLTEYNHNVILELGYALGRGKDVILLLHTPPQKSGFFKAADNPLKDFPSDLNSIRCIRYSSPHDLEAKLLQAFDNLLTRKHPDEQFWALLKNFLKDGSQDTKSISTFMEGKLDFSYQMTRNRLQKHWGNGDLTKKPQGNTAVYELSRSAL
jgi:hypothetical protein